MPARLRTTERSAAARPRNGATTTSVSSASAGATGSVRKHPPDQEQRQRHGQARAGERGHERDGRDDRRHDDDVDARVDDAAPEQSVGDEAAAHHADRRAEAEHDHVAARRAALRSCTSLKNGTPQNPRPESSADDTVIPTTPNHMLRILKISR